MISKLIKNFLLTVFFIFLKYLHKCQNSYALHCLRAAAISSMSDAGFQVMYRCKALLKTYNGNVPFYQNMKTRSVFCTISNLSDHVDIDKSDQSYYNMVIALCLCCPKFLQSFLQQSLFLLHLPHRNRSTFLRSQT